MCSRWVLRFRFSRRESFIMIKARSLEVTNYKCSECLSKIKECYRCRREFKDWQHIYCGSNTHVCYTCNGA